MKNYIYLFKYCSLLIRNTLTSKLNHNKFEQTWFSLYFIFPK